MGKGVCFAHINYLVTPILLRRCVYCDIFRGAIAVCYLTGIYERSLLPAGNDRRRV